jgi:hypothetical protein
VIALKRGGLIATRCLALALITAMATATSASAQDIQPAAAGASPAAASSDVAADMSFASFPDVPENHWAYEAIASLAKDGYIKGYPDGTFKGQRPMTRYEAAVLVNRAVQSIKDALATNQAVTQKSLDQIAQLQTTFGSELKDLQTRVTRLEDKTAGLQAKTTALEKQANASTTQNDRFHLGFVLLDRFGTSSVDYQAINGGNGTVAGAKPGQAIPGNQGGTISNGIGTTYTYGVGTQNTVPLGPLSSGIAYNYAQIFLGGNISDRLSYSVGIASSVKTTSLGATTLSPSYCINTTTTNCSFSDLNGGENSISTNLQVANVKYGTPGGLYFILGRYALTSYGKYFHQPDNHIFSGANQTGAAAGYDDPHGNVFANFFYYQPNDSAFTLQSTNGTPEGICSQNVVGLNIGAVEPKYTGVTPACNNTQNSFGGWALYYDKTTRTGFGTADLLSYGKTVAFWDPAAVTCTYLATARLATSPNTCRQNGGTVGTTVAGNFVTAQANPNVSEIYGVQYFGPSKTPTWSLQGAYGMHFGTDPFTGNSWIGNSNYSVSLTYASKGNLYSSCCRNPFTAGIGTKNSNVLMMAFEQAGQNSIANYTTSDNSTYTFTNATGIQNWAGLQNFTFEYAHWFDDSFRLTLGFFHLQNIPGVTFPIGTNGTPNTCPGCYINAMHLNQTNLEGFLRL